ncbi:hypothetical protein [Chitinophaga niabensis]|uniref:Uncharacterized protein n=1 Tax=Chitinophaga niabensis TaxID=536979 RepID=A0A1N6K4Z3_9BACT|nr:hypothetical protein [Chitinophaga niabensis]SIO51625.1 hypothetical protein SAMN04488055_5085 [Chitinophaga niabensis]
MQLSLYRRLVGLVLLLFISLSDALGQTTFQGMVQIFGNEEGAALVTSKQWTPITKTLYTYIRDLFPAPVVSGTVREYFIVIRKADDVYNCAIAGPHFRFWFEQLGKAGHEFTPSLDWGSVNAGTVQWIKIPNNIDQVYAVASRDGTGTPNYQDYYFRLDARMPDGCQERAMKVYSIFVAAIDKVGGASAPISLNNDPVAAEIPRFVTGGVGGTIVTYQGNVGVGTNTPQSKLAINGTITATKVRVTQTGWSDFVFKENYPLRSLAEVESFIKTNQHLPDIPSEKEVTANGNDLGEMDKKLLQKIEELTLYLIDLKKENEAMKLRLEKLEKK